VPRTEPVDSTAAALRYLWRRLDARRRSQFIGLEILAVLVGVVTLVGVAAVVPFCAVLADPALADSHPSLVALRTALGLDSRFALLAFLGGGFAALVLFSNAVSFFGVLAMNRFAHGLGADLHARLFDEYLRRDHLFHTRTHSTRLIHNIVHEVGRVTTGIVQSVLLVTSSLAAGSMIAGSLLLFSPALAGAALLLLGGTYLAVYRLLGKRLQRNGVRELALAHERTRTLSESFGAIKELLASGAQASFSRRFAAQCREFARVVVNTQTLALAPRHIAECAVAAGLVGAVLWLQATGGHPNWFASLSFLALAAYRLLPTLQQGFAALARLRVERIALATVAAELRAAAPLGTALSLPAVDARWLGRPTQAVCLRGVSFRYGTDSQFVVRDVDLEIPAGAMVGIAGANGSGKSTLIDLLVGLIVPTSGRVLIDGAVLDEHNLGSWQSAVAYVPQNAFILDASASENIALGGSGDENDLARVRDAAALAGLHEVLSALPGGYSQRLGERGVQLSGGQRQRLALARAFYRRASFLVLDESTNALDAATERELIDTLRARRGACTVCIVAHRIESLRGCDLVIELVDGALAARGSYEDYVRRSRPLIRVAP
jgi:ATP-binding cassette, subfamily B, bacterial PglK